MGLFNIVIVITFCFDEFLVVFLIDFLEHARDRIYQRLFCSLLFLLWP